MSFALALVLAYLIGSVPFAYLLARGWAGLDVRRVGSGNVGATNVLRQGHPALAIAVALLDVAKGAAAVWLGRRAGLPVPALALIGLAAIVGHLYPIWLRFHGGKGVATTCGVFALLAPRATLAALVVFLIVVWASRFVSLGSLAGALTLVAGTYGLGAPRAVVGAAGAAAFLIGLSHRANIARLRAGTERRLGTARDAE